MLELALVTLVQGNAGVSAIASVGGFSIQLPKGQALPSWSYHIAAENLDYTLEGRAGVGFRRIQFDCYGNGAADCISLAAAIHSVLNGYSGTVLTATSPITTLAVIQGCFLLNTIDFFDEPSRSYRRMLEYEVWFNQN